MPYWSNVPTRFKKTWVMVRVCEPTVTCADPVTSNREFSPTVVLVAKNLSVTWPVSPVLKLLLPEPVLMTLNLLGIPEPDRVQVVLPEPRTPSTLTIKTALAVAPASVRRTSVTRRLAWRSGEVVSSFSSFKDCLKYKADIVPKRLSVYFSTVYFRSRRSRRTRM